MSKFMSANNCYEHHIHLANYMEKFMEAYPGEMEATFRETEMFMSDDPKFALTWASYLAHDNANLPFHADAYFHDYFEKNREEVRLL